MGKPDAAKAIARTYALGPNGEIPEISNAGAGVVPTEAIKF